MPIAQIKNRWWQVTIDTDKGASITDGRCYSKRNAGFRQVLGVDGAVDPSTTAPVPVGFLMLPFCNRIDHGKFTFNDRSIVFPINRADQSVAIHGLSRDLPWQVAASSDGEIRLTQTVNHGLTPYHYSATLSYRLEDEKFISTLSVTQLAADVLPYGMGFHPWFAVSDDAAVSFTARGCIDLDKRGLPLQPVPFPTPNQRFSRKDNIGMDRYFYGWNGSTLITDPAWGGSLTMTGAGALTNLHMFVSPVWRGMAVEPVSNGPAVLNRHDLARYGAMRELASGDALAGEMHMRWLPDDEDPA
jgi:aldose 1-epimerase